MKQLAFIFSSMVCIILGVNLSIDPANLLNLDARRSDEVRIVRILMADQQAVVPKEKLGFDERVSRLMLLEQRSKADRSVIFGSSRVRYFSKVAFNDELHFVDAVNAATLEDLLVFSYLRAQHKQLPKKLYIALDPWMIEQANSYTRLVEVSYPNAFIHAVENFSFTLPDGSANIYKNLAGNEKNQVKVPIENVSFSRSVTGDYETVANGKLPFGGALQVSFSGWITEGTHYWAWRIFLNGAKVDEGNYAENLQRSPAPHHPRTFVTKRINAKAGDTVTLEMAHADSKGVTVRAGVQQYNAKNFSAQVKCDNSVAQQYKNWLNCNDLPRLSAYQKHIPLVREMLSPAYFQQSLKGLLQASLKSAVPTIDAKPLCLPDTNQDNYVFCADGSTPWPVLEGYESEKIENIVRTIDDGLVPLKSIDGNALKLLKQLTDFYVRNGTSVTYVLVPVHPFSYEKWKSEKDSRGFLLAETTYRKFANRNGIAIVGSYNPAVVGCKNTDFRDWVHPLPRCTNLIASALKRGLPYSVVHN